MFKVMYVRKKSTSFLAALLVLLVLHFLQTDGLNCLPLLAPATLNALSAVECVLQSLFPKPRCYDVLRFSPLERASPFVADLTSILRGSQHAVQIYRIPDDCYELTSTRSSGDDTPTRRKIWMVSSRASRRLIGRWRRSISMI